MNENDFNAEIGLIGEVGVAKKYLKSGWTRANKSKLQATLEHAGMHFHLPEMQDFIDDAFWIQDSITRDIQLEFVQTKTTCTRCPQGTHFKFMMSESQRKRYLQFNALIMECSNNTSFMTSAVLPPATKCVLNIVSKKGIFAFDFADLKHVQINNDYALLTDCIYIGGIGKYIERHDIPMDTLIKLSEACKYRELWQAQRDLELNGQDSWGF